MLFQDSPLMRMADRIFKNGYSGAFASYGLTVHVPGLDIEAYRLLNIEVAADFVGNYRPTIVVHAVIPEGKYKNRIIPNLDQVEVTIYRKQYDLFKPFEGKSDVSVRRYRAILLNAEDGGVVQDGITSVNETTSDLGAMTNVKFQLFSEMTEQFRMRAAGGTYRRKPVANIIRYILLGESKMLDLQNGDEVSGFEMVPPLDAELREVITIPQGIQSSDAPGYIHRHCGGVYSAGFSYYCHQDTWYVYPTYDFTRFNESPHQLTLVIAPQKALPMVEFTCMKAGSALTVLCTGEVKTDNISNRNELESGNGIRFADPKQIDGGALTVKDNKAIFSRGAANNELVSSKRANGLNNVRLADNPITSNRLFEISKLAARKGQVMTVVWENAQADMLVPGMQIKAMYMQGDLVQERRGILVGYQEFTTYTGTGLVAGRYATNCTLMVFLENESEM